MARLQYEQPVTINGKEYSLPENRAVEDWTWNRVKFYSFIFACLAAVGGLLLLGYWLGGSGCYTCTLNKPTVVAVDTPPASYTQAETAAVTADLAKDLSALERMIEQTAIAQAAALATATATAVVVAPPPPKAERRVTVTKQADPACPCPPPDKTQTLDQGPAPPPTLSSAERRRNELWSSLRR